MDAAKTGFGCGLLTLPVAANPEAGPESCIRTALLEYRASGPSFARDTADIGPVGGAADAAKPGKC